MFFNGQMLRRGRHFIKLFASYHLVRRIDQTEPVSDRSGDVFRVAG
ncbi:MAG: hypothetical protein UX56_C0014G0018 [Candidatus Azambacteria bacterium GW2011_GWD2_46_48]|uniref:Uncharacterized protein n=1 Tax=Candidatus Azambacteria bacterium GW2011_GWD2_46_48 TaxID=1618623 RepID=A0A0G1QA47_9BACT|nr:MAG: hypothetical protein UX56_C0014G0018 [Candidatus Azambacteria bacterium GW2011_GWD2_46_48]